MTDYRNRITGLEYVSSRDLTPHPGNWRNHGKAQTEALLGILSEVGIAGALLAYRSERNGGKLTVIDGHLRKDAAPQTWPVLVLDVSDAEADYLLATHDPLAAMATADAAALDALLATVNSGEQAVQEMLAQLAKDAGLYGEPVGDDPGPQIDKAEELRQKWGVESGDLWQLGEHRVICGDCTDGETVGRVMGGEKATCLFTDPPYGVSIGAKNRFLNSFQRAGGNLENIEADDMQTDELKRMLLSAFILARTYLADDCAVFVCAPQGGQLGLMMMMMMREAGLEIRHVLNWVKNQPTFSLGRLDYEYQHEPILFTWTKTHKSRRGGQFHTSVWTVDKPRANAEHPTMKPVALPENAIANHTDGGDIALDPFLGSGTTLIACERLGRRCRGIEISPAYVAVTLQRWADMTGKTPERLP